MVNKLRIWRWVYLICRIHQAVEKKEIENTKALPNQGNIARQSLFFFHSFSNTTRIVNFACTPQLYHYGTITVSQKILCIRVAQQQVPEDKLKATTGKEKPKQGDEIHLVYVWASINDRRHKF